MKDQLVKAIACSKHVRLYAVSSTQMVQEAKDRFDLYPTSAAALGRVLSVASIMGSMLKSDQEMLTINIQGGGPIGSIVVDAYFNGNVRGFVSNPHAEAPSKADGHLNVGAVVGNVGTLTVTKDLSMQENWSGSVALQTGEIGEDFAYYFTLSEQTPTAVSVGVKVGTDGNIVSAGALVLQIMPDAEEADIVMCEHMLSGLKPMSQIVEEYSDSDMTEFVKALFDDVKVLSEQPVAFKCTCSREKTEALLKTVSEDELKAMIEEDKGAEVTCHFCNEVYHFTQDELKKILEETQKNMEETADLEEHVVSD
ncbi:MAG: Hsp33 family molecular chaperone HslO [Erysipelotrichaceae bacterium]|nr:Hsp33 family molecular chaperone HslO [Erysipelotrichaceae bacterium]